MKNTRTQWFCCATEQPEKTGKYELKNKKLSDNESYIFDMYFDGFYFCDHNYPDMILTDYAIQNYCWRGLSEKPKK